jgi:ParB family chromosome partitioning protein
MAKRRKLTAPSADDLNRIDAEFRRETGPTQPEGRERPERPIAPIAQVAGEAASGAAIADAETRAEAAALREARQRGLLITEVPTPAIEAEAMVRDRTRLDEAEMAELRHSIASSGLRLPIEIYPLDGEGRFGLLSGYRRLLAVRQLHAETGDPRHGRIRALIRPGTDAGAAFASMVEENEIRANLSQFERGRIAVVAARSGAFESTEAAVDALFASASRAKRSKVRSFARIFEALGTVLPFPEALTEKQGLRLAAALRAGAQPAVQQALAGTIPDAEAQWQALLPILETAERQPRDPARGGRPAQSPPPRPTAPPAPAQPPATEIESSELLRTRAGIALRRVSTPQGHSIRFYGAVDAETVDALVSELARYLDAS